MTKYDNQESIIGRCSRGLGKIVVFKQMYGKTVMTNYPRKVTIPRAQQRAAQRGTRDNFRDAAAYAKHALKDPAQKVYYEKKKKHLGLYSAYQAAITDYMRKLKLESVSRKKMYRTRWRADCYDGRQTRLWRPGGESSAPVAVFGIGD